MQKIISIIESEKYQAVFLRFIKAFIYGGLASLASISVIAKSWEDLYLMLNTAALAFIIGGLNAVFMAGEKMITWKE